MRERERNTDSERDAGDIYFFNILQIRSGTMLYKLTGRDMLGFCDLIRFYIISVTWVDFLALSK